MTTPDNQTTLQPTRTPIRRPVTLSSSNTSRDSPTTGAADITSLIMTSLLTTEQSTTSRKNIPTSTNQPQAAYNSETDIQNTRTSTSESLQTADNRETNGQTNGQTTRTSTSQQLQTKDNTVTDILTTGVSTRKPIHTADSMETDRQTTGSSASQPRQTTNDRETGDQNNKTTSQPSTHESSTILTTSEKSATSHQGK